jgi:hypothetical protein
VKFSHDIPCGIKPETVGGVAPYFAGSAYVLSWKSDVNGDKTVTASLDPSTGKYSLSD